MRGFAKQTRIHGLAALAAFGLIASAAAQAAGVPTATIRRVDVLNRGQNFEMEIQASDPILPQTQVITGPDRLIVDFPHALPGRSLHPLIVSAGAIKGIRMGLFQSNPPITRVVVDLRSPQSYQIFPSGRSVIVKIMQQGGQAAQGGTAAPVVAMGTPPPTAPPPPPAPRVEVSYTNGKLSILANRGTLGEVLRQVQRLTGASVIHPSRRRPGSSGSRHSSRYASRSAFPATERLFLQCDSAGFRLRYGQSDQDYLVPAGSRSGCAGEFFSRHDRRAHRPSPARAASGRGCSRTPTARAPTPTSARRSSATRPATVSETAQSSTTFWESPDFQSGAAD